MMRSLLLAAHFTLLLVLPVCSEEPSEGSPAVARADLISRLDSSEKAERLEAIAALAAEGKGAANAVAALLKQLDFDDPEVREAGAVALGAIGAEGDKVVQCLIEHFSDEGNVEKLEPVYQKIPLFAIYGTAAAKFGEQALDPLIAALASDSQQVFLGAAIGLEAIGEPAAKATPQLITMLTSTDPRKNRAAAGAIRGIGPGAAEAIPALIELLDADDFHTQYWACRALGAIGPASAVATGPLLDVLANGVVSVRRNAAMALGNIGPDIGPDAVARLIGVLDEEFNAQVREEAVVALGKLPQFAEQSVPALKKVLADPNFPVPTLAARSLWQLTRDPDDVLPALIRALDDLTHSQTASEMLAELGPAAAPAVDRLILMLEERDPDDRALAAQALAHIGPAAAKAEQPLRKLLEDKTPQVREAARQALEALAGDEAKGPDA